MENSSRTMFRRLFSCTTTASNPPPPVNFPVRRSVCSACMRAIPPDAWMYFAIRLSADWADSGAALSANAAMERARVKRFMRKGSSSGTDKIAAGRALATARVPSRPMARVASQQFPNLTVLSHPLIQHKLTILRDKRTSTRDFKQLVNEIAMLMAYEVTKDLPLESVEIDTPLEPTRGVQVAGKKLTLVPILRAGLGMVEGISQLIPSARVGHIGLYRDHDSLQPVDYYFKIPAGEHDRAFFVLDPMLATGGSAVAAVGALKKAGAQRIRFLCLVAAPRGVRKMLAAHAEVPVYAAALDRPLNERGYILPGLGDAGDRLFGTGRG